MKKHFLIGVFTLSILGLIASSSFAGGCPGNCNGHGVCDTNTNTCTCNVGFVGAACDQCAPNYYNYPTCTFCLASTTCSGNGTCSSTGACICNVGFSGADCSIGPPAVPTISEWGLAVMSLVGLIAGTILFTRRARQLNG